MEWIINLTVFLGFFIFMECVAWFTHKYIMHGVLWNLHKGHHQPGHKKREKNDFFGVFFAIISIVMIVFGLPEFNWLFWAGCGMTFYGAAYFFVHDIFVHQRISMFKQIKGTYWQALRKAHKIHHKNRGKYNCESFGFLFVRKRYWPKHNI